MPINHNSHDHDADQPAECVLCCEVVRSPAEHRCKPIGWTEAVTVPDPPLFRFWGTPGINCPEGDEAYVNLPITIKEKP